MRGLGLAFFLAGVLAAPAFADPRGPAFGANSYTTSIDTVGPAEDTDDYVAPLLAGEALTVTVTSAKTSALLPALSLVAPDGTVTLLAPPVVTEKKAGKVVGLNAFKVPSTGRWAVRVSGKSGTTGGYTVKFAIKAAKAVTLTKQHFGGADPLARDVAFGGLDGALLSVTVKAVPKTAIVHIGAVKDPAGQEKSVGAPPVEKKGQSKLTKRMLHDGAGAYSVNLAIDAGDVTYTVTTAVAPQGRPKAAKAVVLAATEPFLEQRADAIRGDGGLTAHLTGSGFSSSPVPTVLFDGRPGTNVVVASDGTSLDVVVPPGAAAGTVEVAVVHADGQASVRPGYFTYVPLPTITGLTDSAGQPVAGGRSAGGDALTLLGTGFLAGQAVRFGAVDATGVAVVDGAHISLVTPATAPSTVPVTLTDEFARTVAAPNSFEYKTPPAYAPSPYSPAYAPTAGGVTVTIIGTGFEPTDQLRFNGTDVTSTLVDSTTRRFTTPAIAPGVYAIEIVDRLGIRTAGPTFEVKDPPAFALLPYSPASATTAGGTSVTITGSNFESADQLVFNGTNLTSAFVNATTRTFTSPTIATGNYTVQLVDRFGVAASGPIFPVKDLPAFAADPYSPPVAPTAGGTVVTIKGSAFESADAVYFAGTLVTSTFVDSSTRRFTTPAKSTGLYSIQIIDRLGRVSGGPNFPVKDAPAFGTNPYAPAAASTSGGTMVTITGSGFESTDSLSFNGTALGSNFVSSTKRTFNTPALSAGTYAVSLTDRFGGTSTGPTFELKAPPVFGSSPYSPAFAGTNGGTAVTITGTGFESTDQLKFNGSDRTSVFVNSTTRTFTMISMSKGSYSVTLTDRVGTVATGPNFEVKDPPTFTANPYSPPYGAAAGGTAVTITGTGFESTDQLKIDGTNVSSTFVNATHRTFSSPALSAGSYSLQIVDRLGQTATGPNFEARDAPSIAVVEVTAGDTLDSATISVNGGASIHVVGGNFAADTTVTFGGVAVTATLVDSSTLEFTAPAVTTGGPASLEISDVAGQTATSTALSCHGFVDETATAQPGTTSVDNFLANRGAIGDLDNDGARDDMAITTDYTYLSYYPYGPSLGTRSVFTRLFFESSGVLSDATSASFPGVSGTGDDWRARAVAVGDLDGDSSDDIVIAGKPFYVYIYPVYYQLPARVLSNDGSGNFSFNTQSPHTRTWSVDCLDSYGATYPVFRHFNNGGTATALAIGDLDGDGDREIVMATDHYGNGGAYIRPQYVTFTPGAYYDANASSHFYSYGYYYYTPGTRIFDNQGSTGFVDVTFPRLPLCGTYPSIQPSFVGRDVKLGDVDGDSAPDIVVTWDQPLTATPYGQWSGYDSARISTEVLINDGTGFFSDQTASWMPAVSSPEFWQAGRVELADLDGDGMRDLVLLHRSLLDGFTTTTSSLRILQNQGTFFADVTLQALPSVPLAGTADDNLRGTSLVVGDVDGDGHLDLLVGTTEALVDPGGNPVRRVRFLRGDGALHFAPANGFVPDVSTDTGEADDLLLGDLAGTGVQSLFLLAQPVPATSTNGERLRVFGWK